MASAQEGQRVALEEVIVTAQKRAENLQEVPLSISAIGAQELDNRGIESLGDLNAVAPNVMIRQNPGARLISTLSIRGSGQGQPAIWIDAPVGLYLNGIYLGKTQGSIFDVVDIERVEVLRGPQGTLFGRNTEGGAVNFVTRRPSGEMSGSARIELGNYDRQVARLQMDLPKMGDTSVAFALRREQADGWATNLTGPDLGSNDNQAFRTSVMWEPSDRLTAVYDFDYTHTDQTPTVTSLFAVSGWGGTFPSIFNVNRPDTDITPDAFKGAVTAGFINPVIADVFVPLGSDIEAAVLPYVTTSRPKTVSTNVAPGQREVYEYSRGRSHALTLEYELSDQDQLKYIAAQRTMNFEDSQDIDGTPLVSIMSGAIFPNGADFSNVEPLLGGATVEQVFGFRTLPAGSPAGAPFPYGMSASYNRKTEYEQMSHELQWIATRDRANWVMGLYYFEDEGETNGSQSFTLFSQPPQQSNYAADTEAWAVFGQMDFQMTDSLTATFGVRYTEEKRSGWTHRFLTDGFGGAALPGGDMAAGQLPFTSYSETFDDTSPMFALSYQYSDDINFYARIANGFKSGGFSSELANPAVDTPFQPQTSLSKEIGMKSEWMDGRARLNVALFHNAVEDLHITQLLPGTTQSLVTNAGESTYQGAEIEFQVQLSENWRFSGNYGYLDASFDKYLDNSFLPGRPIIDTASNRLPGYAPETTYSLQLEGTLAQFSNGTLSLLVDYSYTDDMYLYAVNKTLASPNAGGSYIASVNGIPSITNLNARLALSDVTVGNGTMDFSFFVRNATDEDKMIQGIDFSMFRTANWQEPRTYVFSATYNW
ncbi:TonB-dependent receptor, partial [Aequoribacter sp.]|uniref:TonB-dependent receptor n=2 Tax=Aequoribacter sp. TaxID=2847771 RepID=UPI003C335F8B